MHKWKRDKVEGRGSVGKEIVIGLRQRNGSVRFFHVKDSGCCWICSKQGAKS